ncbi:hypothetical protein [Streptomyces antimycoticus]|uniref:hypothetical protein n=1 Tax=Streptomyces antimycoticus TaxID=68175 RepID=UPI001582882A|nr:hypothetical protein [Streptomyces antimycoticus]
MASSRDHPGRHPHHELNGGAYWSKIRDWRLSPPTPQGQLRSVDLPTQHRDLVAENENLGVARGGRLAQQKEAAQQSTDDQVEQSQAHDQ